MNKGAQNILFKLLLLLMLIAACELVGFIALWLNSRQSDFLANKSYFRIRAMLQGSKKPEELPRFLSLPYLGYIPYPGFTKNGILQHNADGYRGTQVPLAHSGKYRVLCLGGSTTYGLGVDTPSLTYPAQLQQLLQQYILNDSSLAARYTGAEVLNAGIDAGTSAEELQQYLFKYRYYQPHAVVVHSGINDAFITYKAGPEFQPDYTHSRRLLFHLEPLPAPARWLLHSYLCSYFIIRLFYDDFANNGQDAFKHNGRQTYVGWSNMRIDSALVKGQYEWYPFYQNTRSLYRQIEQDSALLLVLPNFLNRHSDFVHQRPKYEALCQTNIALSAQLAAACHGYCVPFTFDSIAQPAYWTGDDCHLTAAGEKVKAQQVFHYLQTIISSNAAHCP